MKQLLISMLIMIISITAMAHVVKEDLCKSQTDYVFNMTSGKKGTATATYVNAAGVPITGAKAFTVTFVVDDKGNGTFNVPRNLGISIKIKVVSCDGYINYVTTCSDPCVILPVKMLYAVEQDNYKYIVHYTVYEITNTDSIELLVSKDEGKTWDSKTLILPKDIVLGIMYTKTFNK